MPLWVSRSPAEALLLFETESPSANHLPHLVTPWLLHAGHTSNIFSPISCGGCTYLLSLAVILFPCYVEVRNNVGIRLSSAQRGTPLSQEGNCNGRQAGLNVAFRACRCVCSFVVWRRGLAPCVCILVHNCLTCLAAFCSSQNKKGAGRAWKVLQ